MIMKTTSVLPFGPLPFTQKGLNNYVILGEQGMPKYLAPKITQNSAYGLAVPLYTIFKNDGNYYVQDPIKKDYKNFDVIW